MTMPHEHQPVSLNPEEVASQALEAASTYDETSVMHQIAPLVEIVRHDDMTPDDKKAALIQASEQGAEFDLGRAVAAISTAADDSRARRRNEVIRSAEVHFRMARMRREGASRRLARLAQSSIVQRPVEPPAPKRQYHDR